MGKSKKGILTKLQKAVINDLLAGEEEDKEVLKKHGVKLSRYHRWLRSGAFLRAFRLGIEAVKRQEGFYISRNVKKAAEKLVGLTEKGEGETARKACLDILFYDSRIKAIGAKGESDVCEEVELDDETAGKMLRVLAERGEG